MYTLDMNGNKVPYGTTSKEGFKIIGDSDNKTVLYVALVVAVLVALGGGYVLYKHLSNKKESFGYRL